MDRKIIIVGIWLEKKKGGSNGWGAGCFLLRPNKILALKFGEKIEGEE